MATLTGRLIRRLYSVFRQSLPVLSEFQRFPFARLRSQWRKAVAVGFGATLCAVPIGQRTEPSLSYGSLMKRAVSLVADSTHTYLSQATYALIEALTEYTKATYALVSLQKRFTAVANKENPKEKDALWQLVVGARAEVKNRHQEYLKLESTWVTAVKLSEMAAEAAYQAGADHVAATAQSHVHLLKTQVQDVLKETQRAECKLTECQAEEIQKTPKDEEKSTAPKEGSTVSVAEEEELSYAYLRED